MITLAALLMIGHVEPSTVRLRGGESPPAGLVVVGVGDAGVAMGVRDLDAEMAQIPSTQSASLVVSWDRVKGVDGPLRTRSEAYADLADTLWRARTRLERGDWVAAEPLFERAFKGTRGKSGATAGVVAEGLLRCRLKRGAHVLAIEPFLGLLAADSPGEVLHRDWASLAGLGTLLDPATKLAPSLPPIWLRVPAVEALAAQDTIAAGWDQQPAPGSASGGPSRSTLLGLLYLEAARFECGRPAAMPPIASSDPGVQLVAQIVQARIGSPEQRAGARKALEERLRQLAPRPGAAGDSAPDASAAWLEAWIRAGLGRSLLRENPPELRQAGVVQLLHLPARFAGSHPYLAGLALAEASAALRDLGDADGADTLAHELSVSFPTHPVLDWDPLRLARSPESSAAGSPSAPSTSPPRE